MKRIANSPNSNLADEHVSVHGTFLPRMILYSNFLEPNLLGQLKISVTGPETM